MRFGSTRSSRVQTVWLCGPATIRSPTENDVPAPGSNETSQELATFYQDSQGCYGEAVNLVFICVVELGH